SPQDRWEENSGISPFTLAIEIVALIAAAEFLSADERDYVLSLADYWNERIEDWTYVSGGPFCLPVRRRRLLRAARARRSAGRAVRTRERREPVGSQHAGDRTHRNGDLHLARLGLRSPDDRRIQNTSKIADALLQVETPLGIAYHRYNEDGYGEHA